MMNLGLVTSAAPTVAPMFLIVQVADHTLIFEERPSPGALIEAIGAGDSTKSPPMVRGRAISDDRLIAKRAISRAVDSKLDSARVAITPPEFRKRSFTFVAVPNDLGMTPFDALCAQTANNEFLAAAQRSWCPILDDRCLA